MNKIQPISSVVPYMTCPGNHEADDNFLHYKQRYNMPGLQSKSGANNNFYYSFDVGNIHYVAISSELYYYSSYFNNDDLIKQYNWLINDLKKADFGQIEEAIEEMGKFDVVVQSKLKEVFLDHILPLKEAA